jgi:hypothetical protein
MVVGPRRFQPPYVMEHGRILTPQSLGIASEKLFARKLMRILRKFELIRTRRSIDMVLPSTDMIYLVVFETDDALSKVRKWNVNGIKSGAGLE